LLGHQSFATLATLPAAIDLDEVDLRDGHLARTAGTLHASTIAWNEPLGSEHQLTPSTKTYRGVAELQQATDAVARREALARQLAALPDRTHLVGLASVSGDRVMTLERFATPELYGRLETELLGSYIASDEGPPHEGRTLFPDDVRAVTTDTHRRITDASTIIVVGP
jgi:hypothetical protein